MVLWVTICCILQHQRYIVHHFETNEVICFYEHILILGYIMYSTSLNKLKYIYVSSTPCTQGLIQTLGSMVIFDENQGVSDLSKYEFLCPIYVKIIKFLVIWHHFDCFLCNKEVRKPIKINWKQSKNTLISPFLELRPSNNSD